MGERDEHADIAARRRRARLTAAILGAVAAGVFILFFVSRF